MTAHELLGQLREKGVEVKTSGEDRLVIDAPRGTITDELRSALAAHKAELLQVLKAEQAESEPVVVDSEIVPSPLSAPPISTHPPPTASPPPENLLVPATPA